MDKTYNSIRGNGILYPLALYLKIQWIYDQRLEEGSYSGYKEQFFPYFHLFKQ